MAQKGNGTANNGKDNGHGRENPTEPARIWDADKGSRPLEPST